MKGMKIMKSRKTPFLLVLNFIPFMFFMVDNSLR